MDWTISRQRCLRASASALAVMLPFLLQGSAEASETTTGSRPLQIVDLGTLPGGVSSSAAAINDDGWVVGSADVGNATSHAFVWRNGRMTS